MHLPGVSGPSRSLEDEFRWLAEVGELVVLVPREGTLRLDLAGAARIRPADYTALTVPSGPGEWIALGRRLVREFRGFRAAIRATRPELVFVSSALLPAALLAARAEAVPSILYADAIHDEPRVASRRRELAGHALIRVATRSASTIVACSPRVARPYLQSGANVATVHPPIATRYADGDAQRFLDDHGLAAGEPLLVAVGALSHGRGQDTLIRALAAVRRTHPRVRLAIVGEPHPRDVDREYARDLRRLAADLAPRAVVFTGFEERVEDAYAAATVVVNPTRREAFGRVACEALLGRRPVVSTAAGGVPDVLSHGEDALLVPVDDPRALAGAIGELLDDPERARRLAETGAARVRSELTPAASLAGFRGAVEATLRI